VVYAPQDGWVQEEGARRIVVLLPDSDDALFRIMAVEERVHPILRLLLEVLQKRRDQVDGDRENDGGILLGCDLG
jgi:hypothetical protein